MMMLDLRFRVGVRILGLSAAGLLKICSEALHSD